MKRIIAFVLLLSMALFLLPACAPEYQPLSDEELDQIVADWRKQGHGHCKGSLDYLGSYNGYHLLLIPADAPAPGRIEIAGYEFHYNTSFNVLAYKQGEFIYLEDAYDSGIISKKAIAQASQINQDIMSEFYCECFRMVYEDLYGSVDHFRFYGRENRHYIAFVQRSDAESTVTTKEIAGSEFRFPKEFFLYAVSTQYQEFIDLEEAYEKGLVSKEAIEEAAKLHAKYKEPAEPQTEIPYLEKEYIHQYGPVDEFREYQTDSTPSGCCIIYAVQQNAPSISGTITVAGSEFKFQRAPSLCLYKFDSFINLEEAYEKGLISKEAIEEAAKLHAEYTEPTE